MTKNHVVKMMPVKGNLESLHLPVARSIFMNSEVGILITDSVCRVLDANPACLKLTGYSLDEILGKNPNIFSAGITNPDLYALMWKALDEKGFWQGEVWNRKKTGEVYPERLTIDVIKDASNRVKNYVAVFSDITYLKKHKDALKVMAYYDALTGLPNRLLLEERIQQALSQAKKNEELVAVCYLDLDGFKKVNDLHGHEHGDRMLVEVAKRLLQLLGSDDTVARPGGDEFVLLVLDLSSVEAFENLLEQVLHELSQPYIHKNISITLTASIGVAFYPLDESEDDTLLRHADQAMYKAKRAGKNCFKIFDLHEEKRLSGIQAVHQEITRGLRDNQFFLAYQPKVNMRTGSVIGVEALIRWQHPEKGLIGPDTFLPVIENDYLIVEIGNWVLREAMQQIRAWRDDRTNLKISVNIAALQLQQADFVRNLTALLSEFEDVPASFLELEILETAAFQDIRYMRQVMTDCRKLGVEFSLDDFGTGYSSLTYLRQLPAEVIKLDRSFVTDMLNDPDDLAIVEGILGLAKAFHRKPLAEGVETLQHGTLLLKLGCVLGQGFAIAKPMTAPEMAGWIQQYQVPEEWQELGDHENPDLKFSMLNMAVEHHKTVSRAISAIEQRAPALLPKHLHDYHECEFGQWLENECNKYCGDTSGFIQLIKKHMQVHDLIKQAASQLQTGENGTLDKIVLAIKQARSELLNHLHDVQNKCPGLQQAT